jgi:hypothetical protein
MLHNLFGIFSMTSATYSLKILSKTVGINTTGYSLSITVNLSASSSSTVTVQYLTVNGTGSNGAIAGTDYISTNGTLSFAPGIVTQTFNVTMNRISSNKYFFIKLSNPVNAVLDPIQNIAVINILNVNGLNSLNLTGVVNGVYDLSTTTCPITFDASSGSQIINTSNKDDIITAGYSSDITGRAGANKFVFPNYNNFCLNVPKTAVTTSLRDFLPANNNKIILPNAVTQIYNLGTITASPNNLITAINKAFNTANGNALTINQVVFFKFSISSYLLINNTGSVAYDPYNHFIINVPNVITSGTTGDITSIANNWFSTTI